MSTQAPDKPAPFHSDEECRNFIDCWCPIPVRAYIARLAAGGEAANTEAQSDLFERIEIAIGRITRGDATMRAPADNTDPDIVLAECRDQLAALQRQLLLSATPREEVTEKACPHERTKPSYDHVKCMACGAISTDSGWGIAANRWFRSLHEARFYKENGRLPDALTAQGATR